MTPQELAAIFKALSDPNRLAILRMLREQCGGSCPLPDDDRGKTVTEIACCFDLALSTVSHHLKELRTAGLIDCVRRGQRVYCSPNEAKLRKVAELVRGQRP